MAFFSAQQDLGSRFWHSKVQSMVLHNPSLSLHPPSILFQAHDDVAQPCKVTGRHAAPLPPLLLPSAPALVISAWRRAKFDLLRIASQSPLADVPMDAYFS